jgi:CBS domain-containing protein
MNIAAILKQKGDKVVSIGPDDLTYEVARTLTEHRIGAALVRDPAGGILGIISERDIVRGMAGQGQGTTQLPAERLMTRDLVTVTPQTLVADALATMTRSRCRHLPVLENGRLVGMVSIGDLVKARIEEAEHEAEELKHFVSGG